MMMKNDNGTVSFRSTKWGTFLSVTPTGQVEQTSENTLSAQFDLIRYQNQRYGFQTHSNSFFLVAEDKDTVKTIETGTENAQHSAGHWCFFVPVEFSS